MVWLNQAIPLQILMTVFHKLNLFHSWILCPICSMKPFEILQKHWVLLVTLSKSTITLEMLENKNVTFNK